MIYDEKEILMYKADGGDKEAMLFLYDLFINDKDIGLAHYYLEKAIAYNYPPSFRKKGLEYEKGIGCPIDLSMAEKYYRKGILLGDLSSKYNLALLFLKQKINKEEAISLLKENANDKHANSCLLLSSISTDQNEKEKYLDLAIEFGNSEALIKKGKTLLENGLNTDAFTYFQKAYYSNNKNALYYLGICYQKGYGVEQNQEKAFSYFLESSKDLDPLSLFQISLYYKNGIHVAKDDVLCDFYYQKALKNGLVLKSSIIY